MTSFEERVRNGGVTLGTFLNLGSALVSEVCALRGFDSLLVDLKHGAGGKEGLVGHLLAGAAHDVPVLVRVESAERVRVGHALDLGVASVMYPRLNTPDEVTTAISHLWYPPRGDRSVASYNRAQRFGGDSKTKSDVNDESLCVVQIETFTTLSNVKDIAATPGVDVLFVGPGDLSAAPGCPDNWSPRSISRRSITWSRPASSWATSTTSKVTSIATFASWPWRQTRRCCDAPRRRPHVVRRGETDARDSVHFRSLTA